MELVFYSTLQISTEAMVAPGTTKLVNKDYCTAVQRHHQWNYMVKSKHLTLCTLSLQINSFTHTCFCQTSSKRKKAAHKANEDEEKLSFVKKTQLNENKNQEIPDFRVNRQCWMCHLICGDYL
jgi:hypothetical protein